MTKTRLCFSLLVAIILWAPMATSVRAVSANIVISEFRTRGFAGGNDEFIELHNISNAAVNIGGWKIRGSNTAGTIGDRLTITAGVTIGPGCFYLVTNSAAGGYSGSVPGNQTYATGITDDGGIAITLANNTIIDAVGMSATSAFKEGTTLTQTTTNVDRGIERKPGGTGGHNVDTDNNATDFQLRLPGNPQNAASTCISYGDSAPEVTSTTPVNGATDVARTSTIVINFSEQVNASASAFVFDCGSGITVSQTASPASSFTLTPSSTLPYGATCNVTVQASQITDTDATDPPDSMVSNYSFSFTTVFDAAPAVTTTTPANGATDVLVDSNIIINFSESVSKTSPEPSGIADIYCNGDPVVAVTSSGPATSFTIDPESDLPPGSSCLVSVSAILISDADTNDPYDHPLSNFTFSFHTASAVDSAPAVTSTSPVGSATAVPIASNIVINFSESVTATTDAFAIDCGGPRTFAQTSGANTSFTLDPDLSLPPATLCTVTVAKDEISDGDGNPPDHLASDFSFSFTTETPVATNVIINEVDADTPSFDTAEFVELYDGGVGNTLLTGLTVVFYEAETHTAYKAFDLDGFTTNAQGYFTLGNPGVNGVDLEFLPGDTGALQNGPDAVALFVGNASSFPVGALLTTANLQDAVVYDTSDIDDPALLTLLNPGQPQVNEDGLGFKDTQSIQRCTNGSGGARNTSTYYPAEPTPDGPANCTAPPPFVSKIVVSQLYGGGGNGGATFTNDYVELFNRSMTETVDITGWSLQYASATGSGWDFNKTPLGGTIAPGEYYLIKLQTNDSSVGLPLPVAPNVTGQINMGAAAGKIAVVDNFDALVGLCPDANPHVMDLVGYGPSTACREGATAAPAPSATRSIVRNGGGSIDTNVNGNDFVTLTPPLPRRTAPIVELGPFVAGTDPGVNAPRDPTIVITFSEPVTTVDPWFDINCAVTGSHNSASQTGSGQFKDITPNVNMQAGETCTMTIFKDQVHDVDTDDASALTDTLLANYVFSFTVATGTLPPYLSSVHLTMGNPSGAAADNLHFNNYLMEKPEFTLSYDRDLGRPNWVSWHLSDEWVGTLTRVDTFRADPAVPDASGWYRVQGFDFSGSGFDRGHVVPNADRDKETSIPINQATFLMTNMMAQSPDNNQGPWAKFEEYLRTLTPANEIYIVAGPAGVGGEGSNGAATTIAGGHVTVPSHTWKVALVLPKGSNDISRVNCSTRTIAVIMPNIQGIRTDPSTGTPIPWENFLTTVDEVEALSGFDVFSELPDQFEYCVEAGLNGTNPPLDTTPPVVSCDAPDGAWLADNAVLDCTATDGTGSGLSHPADAAFTLATSVAAGTEDENASTDSRDVCDRAGNCATAGPIGGNMIDRKAPIVTCGAADSVWHNSNVTIGCTASDGALANAADAAFLLATSVAPGSDDMNASTDGRSVCDLAGNCTAAGPIASNKIDLSNPTITLTTPTEGAIYALNQVVTAAFSCADSGSGPATCAGTVANGVAIDTATAGARTFVVNATDGVGNATSTTVHYSIAQATTTISISNIPSSAGVGGTLVPTFAYIGDGATSVTSSTPLICSVSGSTVTFLAHGICTVVAHATATANYAAATGAPQSFEISKVQTTISINNIPGSAHNGGSFTPTFDYIGTGTTHVTSETPSVCKVNGGTVKFVSTGVCTLTARATPNGYYDWAYGLSQSFTIAP